MSVVFEKTKLLTDKQFHYCPGCNHGIIHRLVAEVIDEMNLDGKVIGVAPLGCVVLLFVCQYCAPLALFVALAGYQSLSPTNNAVFRKER